MKGWLRPGCVLLLVAGCSGSGDDTARDASTVTVTTATTAPGPDTTEPVATTAPGSDTTEPVATSAARDTTVAPSTAPPATSAPPATTAPATTDPPTTIPPDADCDLADIVPVLDDTVVAARLAPGGDWRAADDDTAFLDRTNTAEEFASRLAYTCGARLAQDTDSGAQRLALVAWNDLRHALVLQATDTPSVPYEQNVVFQLFLEQPYGEWLTDQFVWAATMNGGESIVVGTHDYSTGATAKAWQSAVPRFEDLPVTLDAEQHAIDVLRNAGARNVSVAEPAPYGYPIGAIQLNTPDALVIFAAVGPSDGFDPSIPIVEGETTHHDVDGIDVRVTRGMSLATEITDVGWSCHDFAWRFESWLGTPEEILAFAEDVIRSHDC